MQIVVDEIDPQDCPFYVRVSWDNKLPIEYEKGNCLLDPSPYGEELLQGPCYAERGDKACPFCITYDTLKDYEALKRKYK